MQSGQQKFFTIQKINTGFIINHHYNLIACNHITKSIIQVGLQQYRDKYGKKPQSLSRMVPEFLEENELYLISIGYFKLWFIKKSLDENDNNFLV